MVNTAYSRSVILKAMIIFMLLTFGLGSAEAKTQCTAADKKISLNLTETARGVEMRIEQKGERVGKVGNRKEGFVVVTSQETKLFTITKLSLDQVLQRPELATDVLLIGISRLPDFEGEEDMLFAYARDYIDSLQCQ